jgi:hypothetical protein
MRYLLFALLFTAPAFAADRTRIDRTIAKEPKYVGKPNYCLLVFGADARHRVWLVQDGSSLYVDRNGDGDLTQDGEKVQATKARPGDEERGHSFEVGELKVGGKTHKALVVAVSPVETLAANPNLIALPHVAAAVKKNPKAMTGQILLDVECESLKGGGLGGRVSYMVSIFDTAGALQFAPRPADAPVIHLDGPLQVAFYGATPTWRAGDSQDTVLCVGTPGVGPGTFAMVKYEGTVPDGKNPKHDVTFQPKDPAGKPVKELYELKERC